MANGSQLALLWENTEVKDLIISAHGLLPILEILEPCTVKSRQHMILQLLKIVNAVRFLGRSRGWGYADQNRSFWTTWNCKKTCASLVASPSSPSLPRGSTRTRFDWKRPRLCGKCTRRRP